MTKPPQIRFERGTFATLSPAHMRLPVLRPSVLSSATKEEFIFADGPQNVRARKSKTKRGQGRPPRDLVGRDSILRKTRELLKHKPPSELSRVDIAAYCGVIPVLSGTISVRPTAF